MTQGRLPPGISLQSTSGILSGIPMSPGNYYFTVTVSDAIPKTITANFTIRIEDYLVARWKTGPTLDSNTISGSVEVANNSNDTYDQTRLHRGCQRNREGLRARISALRPTSTRSSS